MGKTPATSNAAPHSCAIRSVQVLPGSMVILPTLRVTQGVQIPNRGATNPHQLEDGQGSGGLQEKAVAHPSTLDCHRSKRTKK